MTEATSPITGGCLCGKVRYEAKSENGGGHCYCIDCRKASGTGYGSHMIVPQDDFTLSGDVRFFEKPADSGNMVARGFCPECGGPVYSTNSGFQGIVFVRASSLDDPERFRPQMIVYKDRAPSWSPLASNLPAFALMPGADGARS